jgi:hypothetical protein
MMNCALQLAGGFDREILKICEKLVGFAFVYLAWFAVNFRWRSASNEGSETRHLVSYRYKGRIVRRRPASGFNAKAQSREVAKKGRNGRIRRMASHTGRLEAPELAGKAVRGGRNPSDNVAFRRLSTPIDAYRRINFFCSLKASEACTQFRRAGVRREFRELPPIGRRSSHPPSLEAMAGQGHDDPIIGGARSGHRRSNALP